jgi:hypothetical protein
MRLDRFSQSRCVAVAFIFGHPVPRHSVLPGPLQHSGTCCGLVAKLPVGGPCLRQEALSVQEYVCVCARLAHNGHHLALLVRASCPGVLPCHSHRVCALLAKNRPIHDFSALWAPKGFDHTPAADHASIHQPLHPIRDGLSTCIGYLPTLLALCLRQQAPQSVPGLFAWLAVLEQVGKARVKRVTFLSPLLQCFLRHTLSPTQILSFRISE